MTTLGELVDELYTYRSVNDVCMKKDGVSSVATYQRFGESLIVHFYYNNITVLVTFSGTHVQIAIFRKECTGSQKTLLQSCLLYSVREIPFSVFTDPHIKSARK
jgi:hypothetical protein